MNFIFIIKEADYIIQVRASLIGKYLLKFHTLKTQSVIEFSGETKFN